ncbi:unnamed protein product [Rotaria magnacalcarata]|nr:unnamed protein product [Rotaria magnacalcarata]CAF2034575.1 unnamed protein product [Rotaria magnacalcarata]
MLVQALFDDPHLQNTCYRCICRVNFVKDENVITNLQEYLKSNSMNARYVSCKLLLHLSQRPNVIDLEQVQKIFGEIMQDPTSTEDLWLIVEQGGANIKSIYYNAGQLKDAVYTLLANHLLGDVNGDKVTIDRETNSQSIQQQDFVASEKAA